MKLKELPVLPEEGRVVSDAYMQERQNIEYEEDLVEFVKRWRTLWDREDTKPNEQSLADGSFNVAETLECVRVLGDGGVCEHIHRGESCSGAHIVMPLVFLEAYMAGNAYGVPSDIALIQAHGGYGELE